MWLWPVEINECVGKERDRKNLDICNNIKKTLNIEDFKQSSVNGVSYSRAGVSNNKFY